MSLPNTTTGTPEYFTVRPDWSEPVDFTSKWETLVSTNREAGEQRMRTRQKPRYTLEYTRSIQRVRGAMIQRQQLMRAFAAPLIVPAWCARETISSKATDSVTLGQTPHPCYKVGSWVMAETAASEGTYLFRKITVISGNTLTLETGSGPGTGAWTAFAALDYIYPCIFGMPKGSAYSMSWEQFDSYKLRFSIEEL